MNAEYVVEVARDAAGILALREDWQSMPVDFNADMDFYLAVIQGGGEILRPHAIALKHGGVTKSILACRLEKRRMRVSLGYKKIWLPAMRFLSVVHSGLLGESSEELAELLIESIKDSLRRGEADAAWFYGIAVDSPFHNVLKRSGGILTRDLYPETMHRWRVCLPATYQELYKSRSTNTRHNLKRYSKRLLDAFGNRMAIREFRGAMDFDTMFSHTEEIAEKSYLRGIGVGFRNDDQMRRLVCLTAQEGWLRAYILYIDGRPCAFWNGVLYRRTLYTWTTGYDPDLSEFRPGTYLLQKMLEGLCAEGGADAVDFGFGDAQYKREWSDVDNLQMSAFLFAPTLKSIAMNSIRGTLQSSSNAARKLLKRTGTLQKIKKAWRTRLANRTTA